MFILYSLYATHTFPLRHNLLYHVNASMQSITNNFYSDKKTTEIVRNMIDDSS